MTPTKERLAAALKEAGLDLLAEKAAAGDYDELESDSALPLIDLACDLAVAMVNGNRAAAALRQRMIAGEFDATDEEWDAWDGRR
jgi:hypothetical protein